MFSEDDLLPLSALQHLLFCPRQCALIHIEQLWADNRLTVEGTIMHERVDGLGTESRGDLRIARSLRLRSLRLGLTGRADVVEFHRDQGPGTRDQRPETEDGRALREARQHQPSTMDHQSPAVRLPGARGLWRPFPVEYKRGKPKRDHTDEVQLCAQALCLEEMLEVHIPRGALFYGKTRKRTEVEFTQELREETEDAARRLHRLIESESTPAATYEKKCGKCSLIELCQPKAIAKGTHSARRYLENALEEALGNEETS